MLLGVRETLKLRPVCVNVNKIQQMAGFRQSNESRGEGSGSNEAVISRNKREILHKKEIPCTDNTNTNGKSILKVFSKLCKEERGLKED